MEPTTITPKKLEAIMELLKKADEAAIGIYLFKGLRVQISKYKASGAERFARLYHKRREQGLCVICGKKVTEKNPRTQKLYRLCDEHREKIDKKTEEAQKAGKKGRVKKTAGKKAAVKKTAVKKTAVKKTAGKKTAAKKTGSKKTARKKK